MSGPMSGKPAPALREACVAAGLALLVALANAGAQPREHELHVVVVDGRVSATADQVAIRTILEALGRESGITIRSQLPLSRRVSLESRDEPMAALLHRLLRRESYMYISAPAPGASELWILTDDPTIGGMVWSSQSDVDDPEAILAAYDSADTAANRLHAVTLLATGDDSAALPTLLAAITDPDPAIREEAIFGIGALGGTGNINQLQTALLDPQPRVREAAIEALTDIGADRAATAAALSGLLHDRDPVIRAEAVDALADIGGEAARRYLRRATQDPDALIRETAASYLAEPASRAPERRF